VCRVRTMVVALAAAMTLAACSDRSPSEAVTSMEVPRASSTTPPVVAPTTTVAAAETAPDGPAAVAARLGTLEAAIRDPATPETELAGLGREQQRLYRLLVSNPDWQAPALALVPLQLRPVVEANVLAGTELKKLTQPRPELPKWRIVAPAPAAELLAEYRSAQQAVGVPWQYLAAIHLVETRMGRIRGDSVAGAQGPMQFIPSTWAIYGRGGDVNSNHDSILAAARLLRSRGAPANMAAALYAYNPSQRYVRAITAYAGVMEADERTYLAYHAWEVYYGDTHLPEGFGA
jgi:hypothetical protein